MALQQSQLTRQLKITAASTHPELVAQVEVLERHLQVNNHVVALGRLLLLLLAPKPKPKVAKEPAERWGKGSRGLSGEVVLMPKPNRSCWRAWQAWMAGRALASGQGAWAGADSKGPAR